MIRHILAVFIAASVVAGPAVALAQSDSDATTYGDTMRRSKVRTVSMKSKKSTSGASHAGHAKKSGHSKGHRV